MNQLTIELEHCYGIRRLQKTFDFTQTKTYAVYAPNGAMKSSLAQTFRDVAAGNSSRDRMFSGRVCNRRIVDENGADLPEESIHVISPYEDGDISHTEKASTLLVDSKLRKEYGDLHIKIDKSKERFLKALQQQSDSKKDLEREISSTFAKSEDGFFDAIVGAKDEVLALRDAPFANVVYDAIFDEGAIGLLQTPDVRAAIEDYIKKYNELLAASKYFSRDTFNYFNAATIAKNLGANGFFDAKHTVNLNAEEKLEINSQKQLDDLIAEEKEKISSDAQLRKTFEKVEKLIHRNANLRGFESYLANNEELLPELADIETFRRNVWISYFKAQFELYDDLVKEYQAATERKREIEKEASKQRTQWESVIEIFNSRFIVPFKLSAKNKASVVLGQEPMLSLAFSFEDGDDKVSVEKNALMEALSTGERRAFYILNMIFEIEARKKANQETLFIVDDIADSFDYKNKYAIIQYLQDIAEEPLFRQIILTHNFDFFRTLESRFVKYTSCLIALKTSKGISLEQAIGIKNVFVRLWKPEFFTDSRKRIACIPFIRNIIEFTRGDADPGYIKLTSLLHWKHDSSAITEADLDLIYNSTFCETGASANGETPVVDLIFSEADECLKDGDGINFENKVVLSIAIRVAAERFMVNRINDAEFVKGIGLTQTYKLLVRFKELFSGEVGNIETIKRVVLMTPENIHLNSFMYEPILDMSDEHLRQLYRDVLSME